MIDKVYKNRFAVLLIAMVLILGLALPACTCGEVAPPEEPAAEEPVAEEPAAEEPAAEEPAAEEPAAAPPPAAGELSYEAAVYTNADYGFSVWHPVEWAPTPSESGEIDFVAQAATMVPVMFVDIEEGANFTEALTTSMTEAGGTNINIGDETETTLADGTPAFETKFELTLSGFPGVCFGLGTQLDDGKWVCVIVGTVDMLVAYDQDWFSEVVHTIQFEGAAAPPAEEPAAPAAAGELSYEAAVYTNADYGFSVWHPVEWAPTPSESGELDFVAQAATMVPVMFVDIEEGANFTEALTTSMTEAGGTNINIGDETETTLADGTPAFETKFELTLSGFPGVCFALGTQLDDGKWVCVIVGTVDMLVAYDQDWFSEIVHTIQFD